MARTAITKEQKKRYQICGRKQSSSILQNSALKPLRIVSWSGGKDSTATIILAHEHGLPIDLIVMSIVYFDKKRGIYGENPKHIDWVLNYAKPLFESWGYKVVLVSSDKDYLYWFNHIITKSKKPERNGKRSGWLLGGGAI